MIDDEFERVLSGARLGSGAAFAALYAWLAPNVVSYLRRQGAEDPDDLASEVFLGVFRNIATFQGTGDQFRSWVFSIAHRRLIDDRRKRGRRPVTVPDHGRLVHRSLVDVESEVERHLSAKTVEDLCGDLPDAQRDVLLLRVVSDLTVEQVATILGRSIGATKALQRRGLATIRKKLDKGVPR